MTGHSQAFLDGWRDQAKSATDTDRFMNEDEYADGVISQVTYTYQKTVVDPEGDDW